MKVREIITIKGWQDGSGWSYNQCYGDNIIEVHPDDITGAMDWDWWETEDEPQDGADTEITVEYYAEDAGPSDGDEPLATWSTWENDLIAERRDAADATNADGHRHQEQDEPGRHEIL